jgi:hypothetical protein
MNPVRISISDPWDLGEALQWKPLRGHLLQTASDERGGKALIELDEPVSYGGSVWRYVIAAPRHQGNQITELQSGRKVFSALVGISDQQAKADNPFDTSKWRGGGLVFIGDVEPAD